MKHNLIIRKGIKEEDRAAVKEIVESTGFFHPFELETALELVNEAVARGEEQSSYRFLFLEATEDETAEENSSRPAAYVCYGEIPCTEQRYDIYWIAVRKEMRGRGLGKVLLAATEKEISALGGRLVFLETSSRPQYEPTRQFYLSSGYEIAALVDDYYADGEGMVIFRKYLKELPC
jgi:ribosomal protein S18 acetylase RimI-like enzyme